MKNPREPWASEGLAFDLEHVEPTLSPRKIQELRLARTLGLTLPTAALVLALATNEPHGRAAR